jgi:hypothetical protein
MRRILILALACTAALTWGAPALASGGHGGATSLKDRVEELQQELDSLREEVDDLGEPVEEFEMFDQCAYLIGVSSFGTRNRHVGYFFGTGGLRRWPALAMDIRGFGRSKYEFLAFPAEEPPSIECNEDAGEEFIDQ